MKMLKRFTLFRQKNQITAFLWVLIAVYVFVIPDAILVYRYIEKNYGIVFAGKIPAVLVLLFGCAFLVYLRRSKRDLRNLLYLIPSAVIVLVIFQSVDNPNKHIHIPEYVILAWLVYTVLSRDYDGKGILILVFLCTSLLGVVDELEQGIHPDRSYGWIDMAVNSSSALIGVFSIQGLKTIKTGNWKWLRFLATYSGLIWFNLFGAVSAVFMCLKLFSVQANQGLFQGIYPGWQLAMSILYVINTPLMYYVYRGIIQMKAHPEKMMGATVQLWVLPFFFVFFYMHLLVIYAVLSGSIFK